MCSQANHELVERGHGQRQFFFANVTKEKKDSTWVLFNVSPEYLVLIVLSGISWRDSPKGAPAVFCVHIKVTLSSPGDLSIQTVAVHWLFLQESWDSTDLLRTYSPNADTQKLQHSCRWPRRQTVTIQRKLSGPLVTFATRNWCARDLHASLLFHNSPRVLSHLAHTPGRQMFQMQRRGIQHFCSPLLYAQQTEPITALKSHKLYRVTRMCHSGHPIRSPHHILSHDLLASMARRRVTVHAC